MIYQPRLDLSHGAHAPDEWEDTGRPHDGFVVARDEHGQPASMYGDSVWILTAYHAHKDPTLINFEFWDSAEPSSMELAIAEEIRWYLFLQMWCRPTPLAVRTLSGHAQHLRAFARFAAARSLSLAEVMSSDEHLNTARHVLHPSNLKIINSLMVFLFHLGTKLVGFEPVIGDALKRMRATVMAYQAKHNQHPPIPTRIYLHLLLALRDQLADFAAVVDPTLAFAISCFRAKQAQGVGFDVPPMPSELTTYLAAKGMPLQHRTAISAVRDAQFMAKLQVQAFSGMRDEEAVNLPYDCLSEEEVDGVLHHVIRGSTTKLNRGRARPAKWVTSREGVQAIRLVQRIARLVYEAFGEKDLAGLPLFVSTAYLQTESRPHLWGRGRPRTAHLVFSGKTRERLLPILCAPVTDSDVRELEHIDPHRAWRAEAQFEIGVRWTLTSHQLRRSLALYAQRSGLVSLPALKRQLQHITEEMSRYYASGSAFAEDFLRDQGQHVGREWQETQPVSGALSYLMNAVYSDEVLFGGHVQWLEKNAKDAQGTIFVDREATIRRFKKGELAYRETILGGCTSTQGCETTTLTTFDAKCLSGCSNMVGRLPRLERVIAVQSRFVEALAPGTVEHRTEVANLDALLAARGRVLGLKEAA